jgi:Xaa-Pro aminopeptidase
MTTRTDVLPVFERKEFEGRLARLRANMGERGLEVGVAYGTSFVPGDIQYLTGYDPQLESAALFVFPNALLVIGGPEGEAMFKDQALLGEWRNLDPFKIPGQVYEDTRFWTLPEIFEEQFGRVPERLAALSAGDVLTWGMASSLQAIGIRLDDGSALLRELRYRKTPAELEMFRMASRIATEAMRAMLEAVRPGVTELDVAAAGDAVVKRMGAYGTGFETIVCSGPRVDTIIGRARQRTIRDGDMVMLGVSPRYEGYCSALGRTVVAGRATPEQLAFLADGADALERAAEAFGPGRPARDIDAAARMCLQERGLGAYHAYGVGHGIGLSECLEDRTATPASDYDLPAGIAMMLDVGLFGHPQFYGARHEDPFLITHDGEVERLTDLPVRVW